jgi:hypothetical protein
LQDIEADKENIDQPRKNQPAILNQSSTKPVKMIISVATNRSTTSLCYICMFSISGIQKHYVVSVAVMTKATCIFI